LRSGDQSIHLSLLFGGHKGFTVVLSKNSPARVLAAPDLDHYSRAQVKRLLVSMRWARVIARLAASDNTACSAVDLYQFSFHGQFVVKETAANAVVVPFARGFWEGIAVQIGLNRLRGAESCPNDCSAKLSPRTISARVLPSFRSGIEWRAKPLKRAGEPPHESYVVPLAS